jgi:hypothetical protein
MQWRHNSIGVRKKTRYVYHFKNICVRVTDLDCVWNVMAHAQKPDFVFRRNGRVYLNRQRRQFSRLLEAEVYASAAVMPDTLCSEVVWEYWLPTPFASFPSRVSPCAITFQLDSTTYVPAHGSHCNVTRVAHLIRRRRLWSRNRHDTHTSQNNAHCCTLTTAAMLQLLMLIKYTLLQ